MNVVWSSRLLQNSDLDELNKIYSELEILVFPIVIEL